jgi:hypothetical protein
MTPLLSCRHTKEFPQAVNACIFPGNHCNLQVLYEAGMRTALLADPWVIRGRLRVVLLRGRGRRERGARAV